MKIRKPDALVKGDTIGIVATSRWLDPQKLQKCAKNFENAGFKVKIHPNNGLRLHEWAGSLPERAKAFTDYWCDPEIKAIVTAAGGTRTLHLLDHLDFETLKQHQKILIGYSDNTALLNALLTKCETTSLHGPDAGRFSADDSSKYLKDFFNVTSGKKLTEDQWLDSKILNYGEGEGYLIGGNLCIFTYLMGSEYAPDFKDAILFIEDEMEELRNIDRMLLQLKRLGKLKDLSGIIVGGFSMNLNNGRLPFPYEVEDLIKEHTKGLNIPVVVDAPFGHGKDLKIMPVGTRIKLTADKTGVTYAPMDTPVNAI